MTARRRVRTICIFVGIIFFLSTLAALAQDVPIPFVDLNVREAQSPEEVSLGLQILFLITILSLAPSIIIMTTSFIRISIVLTFVQRALSLQEVPPRAIIMGLSIFLTFFIMQPTLQTIYDDALRPYLDGNITVNSFYGGVEKPMRTFMLRSMNTESGMKNLDLMLFISKQGQLRELTKSGNIEKMNEIPTLVIVPAFIINELTIAFKMGVYIFIPFIVIDLIVASSLMAMGMIMLPPVMISLPIKILLFIAVDGWKLLTFQLAQSFS